MRYTLHVPVTQSKETLLQYTHNIKFPTLQRVHMSDPSAWNREQEHIILMGSNHWNILQQQQQKKKQYDVESPFLIIPVFFLLFIQISRYHMSLSS